MTSYVYNKSDVNLPYLGLKKNTMIEYQFLPVVVHLKRGAWLPNVGKNARGLNARGKYARGKTARGTNARGKLVKMPKVNMPEVKMPEV